jgi:hypothetical protein
MIKNSLYPKTRRIGNNSGTVFITEKIDGSNLGFFKHEGALWVVQRNMMYPLSFVSTHCTYRGLVGWLTEYGEHLQEELHENACIFGEWVGMGKLQYPLSFSRFLQFAKCNVVEEDGKFSTKNLYYDPALFKWSYQSQEPPEYIGAVPVVRILDLIPSISDLDILYDDYRTSQDRHVEGFIINVNNTITKYVRMKNGQLKQHTP